MGLSRPLNDPDEGRPRDATCPPRAGHVGDVRRAELGVVRQEVPLSVDMLALADWCGLPGLGLST
jgi:hypothetical protein